jgi:hypothetical protein
MAPPTKNTIEPYRMVLLRPIKSPTRPTNREDINAPISRMATAVPMVAGEGWSK